MSKIKIGFIGSGGAAKLHARDLKNFQEAHIQAFSDVDEKTAQEASKEFGGTVYKTYDEMLDQENLDATYICTPPMVRLGPIERACEKGLHIFLEKPFAPTLDEGKKIYQAVTKAGKNFQIGYQTRFQPAVRRAKEVIADGSIGPITMFYGE